MFDPRTGRNARRKIVLASAVTAVAATTGVAVKAQEGTVVIGLRISGGTARTVQIEANPDGGANWYPVGTSRTTTGNFLEVVPAAAQYRVNVSANTGSTISADAFA